MSTDNMTEGGAAVATYPRLSTDAGGESDFTQEAVREEADTAPPVAPVNMPVLAPAEGVSCVGSQSSDEKHGVTTDHSSDDAGIDTVDATTSDATGDADQPSDRPLSPRAAPVSIAGLGGRRGPSSATAAGHRGQRWQGNTGSDDRMIDHSTFALKRSTENKPEPGDSS